MELSPEYLSDPAYQKMEEVFTDYVAQGQGRNIRWLVEKTALPLTVVSKGMVKGCWMQRIEQIGRDAASKAREAQIIGDVAGLNTRHAGELADIIDATQDKLVQAIREDRVSPAVMAKLNIAARDRLREILGLSQGGEGDIVARMQKILGASMTENKESKPFVLDRKKLEMPPELPNMPGMTSDIEDDRRELDEDEKESLRGG